MYYIKYAAPLELFMHGNKLFYKYYAPLEPFVSMCLKLNQTNSLSINCSKI